MRKLPPEGVQQVVLAGVGYAAGVTGAGAYRVLAEHKPASGVLLLTAAVVLVATWAATWLWRPGR